MLVKGDDICYQPERHGFETVAELETGGSYEFDTTLLVRGPDRKLYAAHDSGCSCPTPFEGVTWPADWVLVTSPSDVEPLIAEHYSDEHDAAAVAAFKSKVRTACRTREAGRP